VDIEENSTDFSMSSDHIIDFPVPLFSDPRTYFFHVAAVAEAGYWNGAISPLWSQASFLTALIEVCPSQAQVRRLMGAAVAKVKWYRELLPHAAGAVDLDAVGDSHNIEDLMSLLREIERGYQHLEPRYQY
jgi:hypothetical protein